jgi:hypothetical protein
VWRGKRGKCVVFSRSCPAHGTWFDREEIASVIAVCGELRRAQSEEKASPEEAAYRAVQREGRSPQHTSNGLAHYFLNVAGRAHVMSLVHDWLGRPASETYGGNYGVPAPTDLGYTFTEANGAKATIAPDVQSGIPNHLSTHTLAEFMKRLAAWDDAPTRMPDLTKPDVETLFYGPETSAWYPGELGGLAADTTIFVQSALDMDAVEKDSHGRWRTFGKLGFGDGEFVLTTYTCLPVLDAAGAPIPDRGAEMVIATRATSGALAWAARDQQLGKSTATS